MRKSLSTKAQRCTCGWFKAKSKEPTSTDHRCMFSAFGRRCPLPGTMTPYLPATDYWYCRRHYKTLGDHRLGEAELIYIEENYQKIINEEYRDWRLDLFK